MAQVLILTKDQEQRAREFVGRPIYYTGDAANHPGYGRVITYRPATRWSSESVDVQVDDGSRFGGVSLAMFGEAPEYRRFWWADEWRAHQAQRAAEGNEAIRCALAVMRAKREAALNAEPA